MKKVFAINGSSRPKGNTSILLNHFFNGAKEYTNSIENIKSSEANIDYCNGCVRCNLIGRCSNERDEWHALSKKILNADILVFASPVYFHHISASMKKIIDRFRSFVKVEITEAGLNHIPWHKWEKEFVLILTMGSSNTDDAQPVIELFRYITSILGEENTLHIITANRLTAVNQLLKTQTELEELYAKLGLKEELAKADFEKNRFVLNKCYNLGKRLARDEKSKKS